MIVTDNRLDWVVNLARKNAISQESMENTENKLVKTR